MVRTLAVVGVAALLWGGLHVRPGLQECAVNENFRTSIIVAHEQGLGFNVSGPETLTTGWIHYVYEDAESMDAARYMNKELD